MHLSRVRSVCTWIIVLLLLAFFCSCGYHLKGTEQPTGIEIYSLAIPLITSTSSAIGFEADFTAAIREEFISHMKVPIVSEMNAQAVLSGKIYEVRTEPFSYRYQQKTIEDRTITYEETNSRWLLVRMDMKMTKKGVIVWHDSSMEEKASYRVETDPLQTRHNQRLAVEKIAHLLAKKIYLRTVDRF